MGNERLKEQISKLPQEPGVYFFKDEKGKVLYVGKATSLRDRVRSYFAKDLADARGQLIVRMVAEAADIAFEQTDSTLEALILEANWIKKLKPAYNTKEKDDKSYNYVVITKEDFPRVLTVRGHELAMAEANGALPWKARYAFGPYTQGSSLKEALKIVRRIFPYRDAKCAPGQGRPCFSRQVGLCPGVCTGEVGKREYSKAVRNIVLFFEGKKRRLLSTLEREMRSAAKAEEFEKAQQIKRQLFALTHIQDVSLIKEEPAARSAETVRLEAYDVAHISGTHVVGVMVVVEDGEAKKSDYRKFRIRWNPGVDDTGALREILVRRLGHPEWPLPSVLLVDGGVAQSNAAKAVLAERNLDIPVIGVTKDDRHRPDSFVGDEKIVAAHKRAILLANSEAHRFAIAYHRLLRGKFRKS